MRHKTVSFKAQYQKPDMARVALRPEEAVLAGCKVSGFTGSGNKAGCVNDIGNKCNALAS